MPAYLPIYCVGYWNEGFLLGAEFLKPVLLNAKDHFWLMFVHELASEQTLNRNEFKWKRTGFRTDASELEPYSTYIFDIFTSDILSPRRSWAPPYCLLPVRCYYADQNSILVLFRYKYEHINIILLKSMLLLIKFDHFLMSIVTYNVRNTWFRRKIICDRNCDPAILFWSKSRHRELKLRATPSKVATISI